MALLLGVSWLCLLLWGCNCYVSQKGYNTAHGNKNPQTYNQFNRRESFKDNYIDEREAMRQKGFVSLQTEPLFYKKRHRVSPVGDLRKNMPRSQPDLVHKADKLSLIHVDHGDNELWSRRGASNQISDARNSIPAAADSTLNLISSSGYGKQVLNPPSTPYHQHDLASRNFVSNYITSGSLPDINDGLFISVFKNQPVQSGYKRPQPIQFPLVSSGEEYSFSHHKAAYPDEHLRSPSQDFSYFSKTPKKTSRKKVSSVENQMFSGGFKHHKGLHREHQAYVPSQQNPPSLDSFSPRSQFFANHVSKEKKKTVPSARCKPQKQDRFTVTLPSSSCGSSRHCNYIKYNKVDTGPSTLTALTGDEKKSQLHNQNLIAAFQEPNDYTMTKFRDRSSAWMGMASHGAKNQLSSLSADDRFLLQHGGYEDAVRAGLVKPIKQLTDHQISPDSINKRSMNLASWPSMLLSEPKGSDSNCIFWKNTKSPPTKKSQKLTQSSVNAYVQSKNRSARGTAYMLKTCYTPYQRAQVKNAKHTWKLAVRQHM
ncbi:uncharacterized protein LOC121647319 [Melanotaenia boesemani]|uniref:uncharacterized protein LOC121647319 n=1 Tax=Melanotaenia boesemani TaxID=1250792 RepID=UPI001C0562A5|nr:uncharacterized protein LOC121647319 [Melanotaenia boesemani]